MWINNFIIAISGLAAGASVSAGLFAFITSIGVITRMADKSHTASHIIKYESAVIYGGIIANTIYVFRICPKLGVIALGISGVFTGIFVGALATALAEAVKATAVFGRRVRLHTGVGIIILSMAIGKTIASLLFFYFDWYITV